MSLRPGIHSVEKQISHSVQRVELGCASSFLQS